MQDFFYFLLSLMFWYYAVIFTLMLDIEILVIGSLRNKNLAALAEEYLKRLKPFAKLKVNELPAQSFSQNSALKVKTLESQKLDLAISRRLGRRVFLLDEKGEEYSSPSLAKLINHEPLLFVLAGTQGFTDELKNKYPKLALSKLTFPHEMARVLLLEQIYRSACINTSKSYHY